MALPLPYAPNIDVDAERLRDASTVRNIDVTAGLAPAVSGAMAMQEALDKGEQKRAAAIFQKEYLDKGKEGALKIWEDLGKPADKDPSMYFYDSMTPEQAQQAGLLYAKDALAVKDRMKTEKVNKAVSDAAAAGADAASLAALTGDAKTIIDATAKEEENAAKALEKSEERILRAQIKADDRAWDKTMAAFRASLDKDVKAGKATVQITDDLAELAAIDAKRQEYKNKKRLTDVDRIEYADVVRQGTILKERIAKAKRDGAKAPKKSDDPLGIR